MRGFWLLRGLKVAVIVVVAIAVVGWIVMSLWNWLLPPLFGWPVIGYAQAVGIFVLSKLLLGGWRGGHHHGFGWRQRMMARWERMSPEEREQFRSGLRRNCGSWRGDSASHE